ncbi:MAG: PilZ domain-containing protein [Desulfobulbaceae bacterium]|nr:PilZ domain-containing protein [Desulfobulbaceae bacterium]
MDNTKCPYWSKNNSKECRMTKGGLYIPMPEHIAMFCATARCTQCHQYIRGTELLQEAAKKYGFIVDGGRRRYWRVADRVPLRVFVCDKERNNQEILDDRAVTVDLGLGGLRIESHKKISRNTFVSLEFASELAQAGASGLGEVKWCEAKDGSSLFEAGIAFSDFGLTEAIGVHLGLPMM